LRPGGAAVVPAVVSESGDAVGGQACGVGFVDGQHDAGLPGAAPRRQPGGGPHGSNGCVAADATSLQPPVNEEAPQEPGTVIIRPAGKACRPALQSEHSGSTPVRLNDTGVPRFVGQAGQGHPQGVPHKAFLARAELQLRYLVELDGLCVGVEVPQRDEPDPFPVQDCAAVQDCTGGQDGTVPEVLPAAGSAMPAGSIQKTSQR
jgi:hypothetical protein